MSYFRESYDDAETCETFWGYDTVYPHGVRHGVPCKVTPPYTVV